MKLDNKGFTLVEVLAVLVIMVVIMGIAIPNLSSSFERSKSKQNEARKEVLESYAELYIADNKNNVTLTGGSCCIKISDLQSSGYATDEDIEDSDGKSFSGVIVYTKDNNSFEYTDTSDCTNECIP